MQKKNTSTHPSDTFEKVNKATHPLNFFFVPEGLTARRIPRERVNQTVKFRASLTTQEKKGYTRMQILDPFCLTETSMQIFFCTNNRTPRLFFSAIVVCKLRSPLLAATLCWLTVETSENWPYNLLI